MRTVLDTLSLTYWIIGCVANDVVYAARLPFDPGSPPWGGVLRGGVLEPGAHRVSLKSAGESNTYLQHANPTTHRGGPFSLRRGLK
jgi:hypothetical protein